MKRFKVFFLMLAVAALSVPALANPNVDVGPEGKVLVKTSIEGKGVILHLANLQKITTTVTLESLKDGKRLYREVIEDHNGYLQNINLMKLPTGRYTIKVKNDGQVYTKIVKVEADKVLISS